MTVIRPLGLVVLLAMCADAALAQPSAVRWGSNLNVGVEQAAVAGKPLVVFFYRRSSGGGLSFDQSMEVVASEHFERKLFLTQEFQAYANDAVFVRVSVASLPPQGVAILQEMKIDRFPAVVVFDVTKDELFPRGELHGARKPDQFLKEFKTIFENRTTTTGSKSPRQGFVASSPTRGSPYSRRHGG